MTAVANKVLELSRQREQQARQAEEAKLAKQQAAEHAQEEQQTADFLGMVRSIYNDVEMAPEDVLDRLDKCGRTADELNEFVAMLQERQEKIDWLTDNPQTVTVQTLAQDIKDAEAAYQKAGKHLSNLQTNYATNRAKMEQHDQNRRMAEARITQIDQFIPQAETAKKVKG